MSVLKNQVWWQQLVVAPLAATLLAAGSGCGTDDGGALFASSHGSATIGSGGAGGGDEGQGGGETGGVPTGGDTSTTTGAGPACADLGEACSTCELDACPELYCACHGNADCGLYASCVFACETGDAACLQACNTAHPDGITDAVRLNDCAANACPSACADYPLLKLTPCQRCLYASCEAAMNTCLADAPCTAILFCLDGCQGDALCENGCYAQHAAGLGKASAVGACAQASCTGACS